MRQEEEQRLKEEADKTQTWRKEWKPSHWRKIHDQVWKEEPPKDEPRKQFQREWDGYAWCRTCKQRTYVPRSSWLRWSQGLKHCQNPNCPDHANAAGNTGEDDDAFRGGTGMLAMLLGGEQQKGKTKQGKSKGKTGKSLTIEEVETDDDDEDEGKGSKQGGKSLPKAKPGSKGKGMQAAAALGWEVDTVVPEVVKVDDEEETT